MESLIIFIVMVSIFLIFGLFWLNAERGKQRQREFWDTLPASDEPLHQSPECSRCQGRMTRGYLLDHAHAAYHTALWLEGVATPSGFGDRIVPRLERSVPVTTFRCKRCGYLESYARPELVSNGEAIDKFKEQVLPEL